MSATFKVIGTDIKIIFEYTAEATKVQTIVGECAEHLW